MPQKADKPDIHLRLELDTPELYEAWQAIKKNRGIRSNTDALRNLILDEYKKLTRLEEWGELELMIDKVLDRREKEQKKNKK